MSLLPHLVKNLDLPQDFKDVLLSVVDSFSWTLPEECFLILLTRARDDLLAFWEKFKQDGFAFFTLSMIDAEILHISLADRHGDLISSRKFRISDGEELEKEFELNLPIHLEVFQLGNAIYEITNKSKEENESEAGKSD